MWLSPPGTPANRRAWPLCKLTHSALSHGGPWVNCRGLGQLSMFTTPNAKNKSFAWILYINQLANNVYGTKIKARPVLLLGGNWVSQCEEVLAQPVWPWLNLLKLPKQPSLVLCLCCWMLHCGAESVWSEESLCVSEGSLDVCYTCERARQMLAGSQADGLSSPWPSWLWLWHGDTQ